MTRAGENGYTKLYIASTTGSRIQGLFATKSRYARRTEFCRSLRKDDELETVDADEPRQPARRCEKPKRPRNQEAYRRPFLTQEEKSRPSNIEMNAMPSGHLILERKQPLADKSAEGPTVQAFVSDEPIYR